MSYLLNEILCFLKTSTSKECRTRPAKTCPLQCTQQSQLQRYLPQFKMMLSTMTAAKDGVCQGDDGVGTLPLSKYGDRPCHFSLIWEARGLKFQDNRERGRDDLHVVLGDTERSS